MAGGLFRRRTQGTECWFELGEGRNIGGNSYLMPRYSGVKNSIRDTVSGYDDGGEQKFYFVERDHLLVCDLDHTEVKCLYGMPNKCIRLLAVNDQGVFLSEGSEDSRKRDKIILWLTHEGKLRKKISLKGRIEQTYICGNLIFYRREEYIKMGKGPVSGGGRYSAYWMDMNTETEKCIIMAAVDRCGKDTAYHENVNCKAINVEYLMGNDQGAVFYMSCYAYDTDREEMDDIVEAEAEGWYYYCFSTQRCTCMNVPAKIQPYLVYSDPQKYQYNRNCFRENGAFTQDGWIRGGNSDLELRGILAFNMEKNLMWVLACKGQRRCLIPMNIAEEYEKRTAKVLPIWKFPADSAERNFSGEKIYFDGERLYYYGQRKMCSLSADGKEEEWPIDVLPAYKSIFRFGGCVFIQGGDSGYDQCFICPASHSFQEILSVWPYIGGWGPRDKKVEGWKLIEAFDNACRAGGKKRPREEEWSLAAAECTIQGGNRESRGSSAMEGFRGSGTVEGFQGSGAMEGFQGSGTVGESLHTGQNAVSASQMEYWAGFRAYAAKKGLSAGLKLPEAADHNWYAIRLGSATFRIECSVNARKETGRVAFFVKKAPDTFARLMWDKNMIGARLGGLGEIVWDDKSQAASVSIVASRRGKSTAEQYEWFCQAAERLYAAVSPYLGL